MNQKMIDILEAHEQRIAEKYKWFVERSGADMLLTYGPTHIIYDDYNLNQSNIDFCRSIVLEDLKDPHNPKHPWYLTEMQEDQRVPFLNDVLICLNELEQVPEDERYVYEEEDF